MLRSSGLNFKFFKEEFNVNRKMFNTKLNTVNFTDNLLFSQNNFLRPETKGINNFFTEVKIQRVRFKPGYQRLWRGFRLALSELLNYKHCYQHQLTKYLTKFYRRLHQNYISHDENSIEKVIVYSKLLPDMNAVCSFFNNSMIFINSKKLQNLSLYVYKNDFIQLEVSN